MGTRGLSRLGAGREGFLEGRIRLPVAGKWRMYFVIYRDNLNKASADDTVEVVINGLVVGTYNDASKGAPCTGADCLDKKGLQAIETEVVGSRISYRFNFKSGSADPESHLSVGCGEAAFLSAGRFGAPIPAGPTGTIKAALSDAVDGKVLMAGKVLSDGFTGDGFTVVGNPRVAVLRGTTFVREFVPTDGTATMVLPAGQYACVATLAGFMMFYEPNCGVAAGETKSINFAMSPVLAPGQARIVLTWAADPKDLDSYLLAPSAVPGQPPCEVWWKGKNCFSGSVRLDVDATKGLGPETVTIAQFNPGQYVFRVDEYKGAQGKAKWLTSKAMVTYYSPHLGAVRYFAGTDGYFADTIWYVLAIDGTTRAPTKCTPAVCPIRLVPAYKAGVGPNALVP